MWPRLVLVFAVSLILFSTPAQASYSAIQWATPEAAAISLSPGIQRFEVEVECESDDYFESDYVVFQLEAEEIEIDENFGGTSPSFVFWFWVPGTYRTGAYCVSEDGTKGQPNDKVWRVQVPRGPTAVRAGDCLGSLDPTTLAQHPTYEARWVADRLASTPGLWHRAGPWTCTFLTALDPLDFARQVLALMIQVRTELQKIRFCDTCENAWDYAVASLPQVRSVWSLVDTLHPATAAAVDALQMLDAMASLRRASIEFLTTSEEAALTTFQQTVGDAIPEYERLVSSILRAADGVRQLGVSAGEVATLFEAIGRRAEDSGWTSWAADLFYMIARQADEIAQFFEDAAIGVSELAAPLETDLSVMNELLHPPNGSHDTIGINGGDETPSVGATTVVLLLGIMVRFRPTRAIRR